MEAWPWLEEDFEDEGSSGEEEVTYHFQDSETFLAALELYNREGCSRRQIDPNAPTRPSLMLQHGWVAAFHWECCVVAGNHRKGCSLCSAQFHMSYGDTPEYYLVDTLRGMYRSDKMCFHCMDDLLYEKYGTEKEDIMSKLKTLREQQPGNLVPRYQHMYIDYPIFIRHCKNNDEEKMEQIQEDLAQQLNSAFNG